MKLSCAIAGLFLITAGEALATEQTMLARVTVYWRSENSGGHAYSNGARLRSGHCAVDPRQIPFGSKVIFPDAACVAIDTGPAVVTRKAARLRGRNRSERNAIVVDRFFETKTQALAWARAHPPFMHVRVTSAGDQSKPPAQIAIAADSHAGSTIEPARLSSADCATAVSPTLDSFLRCARRRT